MQSKDRSQSLSEELRALFIVAVPLIAAYLAEYAMFLTTKIVVGRLGYRELAAVGLAGDLSFELLVILQGLLSVVAVLVAQAQSRSDRLAAGHATRQGILVSLLLAVPAFFVVWRLDVLMHLTGQEPDIVEIARPYLLYLAPGIVAALLFTVLRSFVSALSQTVVVMVITVAAVGFNYVLTVGLVFGRYGLPAMGVAGAGLATAIVLWVMFLALLLHIYTRSTLRGYGVFKGWLTFDRAVSREIIVLGVPVAALVFLEGGLFIAVSIMSGVLGAKTLAAYEILMGWVGIPFVIALGMGEGTMVRVAYGSGRNDIAAARYSGNVGMCVGAGFIALLVIVPLALPHWIIRVFLDPKDPGFSDVSLIVTNLLVIVAIFQIFDGLQAIAARALRAMRDTVIPLWMAAFGYWVLGIGGGSLFAFGFGFGAAGLWLGLAVGLIVTGSLLCWRFLRLTKQPAQL